MRHSESNGIVKATVVITYIAMIVVNALANMLPINGVTTGQVSDSYPNLFAPAGITFAIWGFIYLFLAVYSVYQLGWLQKDKTKVKTVVLKKIGILFSISSIANIFWIFSWHYKIIPLSMLLMIVILICLILITALLQKETLSRSEKVCIQIPFSVYFGWITVATIANATTLLVSLHWNGFGISEQIWTVLILLVGTCIGVYTTIHTQDVVYGLVFIWAYIGILIKHVSRNGFAFQYEFVVYTVLICLLFLSITTAAVLKISKQE